MSIIVMMGFAAIGGCASETTFAIERRLPASVPLPPLRSLAVAAFVGSGSESLRPALQSALAAAQGVAIASDRLDETLLAPLVAAEDDAGIARLAHAAGVDAVVTGRVLALDVSRALEAPTLVTKRVNGQPQDVPTVRRLKTGRLSLQFRVVLASGRVVRGLPIEKDVRAERTEDPMPHLTTLEPKDMPRDPIPSDAQLAQRLLDEAATDIAHELTPRVEPVVVVWEDAGDANEPARSHFAQHDFARAAVTLREQLGEPLSPETHDVVNKHGRDGLPRPVLGVSETAAALYDLGLCEDALGHLDLADRFLDRALTLDDSERHLAVLRDVRRRADSREREARR